MSTLYLYIFPLLLGFIQGLSEFLPISSSGHLVLFNSLFKTPKFDLFFVLILHLGTLMAILSYYKKELWNILRDFSSNPLQPAGEGRWVYWTALATLPGVLGAFALKPLMERAFHEPQWTGAGFILTGLLLILTHFKLKTLGKENLSLFLPSSSPQSKKISSLSQLEKTFQGSKRFFPKNNLLLTILLIGFSQTLAFFPGISRSGWTISTALFLGWPRKQAIFFSFLLAIPAILGGSLWEWFDSPSQKNSLDFSLCLAFFSSWFFGSLALKGLTYSLKKNLFPYFAFYLWPLGILTLFIL